MRNLVELTSSVLRRGEGVRDGPGRGEVGWEGKGDYLEHTTPNSTHLHARLYIIDIIERRGKRKV